MHVRITRLDPSLPLPAQQHEGDAGYDLRTIEQFVLEPGQRRTVATGLALAIPAGVAGLVLPRSGLAANHGVTILNAPGLIDCGYRGELRVLLLNTDRATACRIAAADRIAQLVVVAVQTLSIVEAEELSFSARGAGGFGSSGN